MPARRGSKPSRPATESSPHPPPEPCKVGRRGEIVIPADLRRRFGIREGGLIIAESRAEGILIRPAVVLPVDPAELLSSRARPELADGRPLDPDGTAPPSAGDPRMAVPDPRRLPCRAEMSSSSAPPRAGWRR